MKFLEAIDANGDTHILAFAQIKSIRRPKDGEDFGAILMIGGGKFRVHRDDLEKLDRANDRLLPAAPGWTVLTFEQAHTKRADAEEKVAVQPFELPLIGWRIGPDGEVWPITPDDHFDRYRDDTRGQGRPFAYRRAVVSPEGRLFACGGAFDLGEVFATETTLSKLARDHIEEREEAIAEWRKRDAERMAKGAAK